jgi:hypothetical protein
VEALVLVTKTAELRSVLELFYGTLELPFRPESVADLPGIDVPQAIGALADAVRERYGAEEAELGEETLLRARSHRDEWRAAPFGASSTTG